MRHYTNYIHKSFKKSFSDALNIDNLIASSVDLVPSQVSEKYERECCIDFSGVAAALFYMSDAQFLCNILKNKALFTEKKIRLHFRFLMVYPYGAHAIARIQAETSRNRATMKEKKFKNCSTDVVGQIDCVDMRLFENSNFVRKQREFLSYIGRLMRENSIHYGGEHRIVIRFTPTAVNVCMYRVNDIVYISPYLLARESIGVFDCVTKTPVIEIRRSRDLYLFNAYMDHFRYLWGLPQALYLEDATEFKLKGFDGIDNIRPPHDVDFVVKSKRIIAKKEHSNAISWRKQAKDLLLILCPEIPEKIATRDTIFIACSWSKKKEVGPSPNDLAVKLEKWLKKDFGENLDVELINVQPGCDKDDAVYKGLNRGSVGIILMTADLKSEGKYYSKPNIYHELGYLMAKCSGHGRDFNVIIIVQSKGDHKVVIPSNVNNKGSIDLQDNALFGMYHNVVWSIKSKLSLDQNLVCSILDNHKKRIEKMVLRGDLSRVAMKLAYEKISNDSRACCNNKGCERHVCSDNYSDD